MKGFGQTPRREETERHQHGCEFFVQVAWELHVPDFLQPFVSDQEAARPAGERLRILEIVECTRAWLAVAGQHDPLLQDGRVDVVAKELRHTDDSE